MRPLILALTLAFASPALAADCPAVADQGGRKAELLLELRDSTDPMAAAPLVAELWAIWTTAPDARAQELLDRGMAAREAYDLAGARAVLDELVAYCPDYAEGWNQRAFAAYLAADFGPALEDLDRALEIDPVHVPALSGKALTLMQLGRPDDAQLVLRDAVRLNPHLAERGLLTLPLDTDL